MADQRTRLMVDAVGWDGDGKPDVIGGSNVVRIYLNQSEKGRLKFNNEPVDPKLPPIKAPRTVMADINHGDEDMIMSSGQGTVLVERSFIRNGGYAAAKVTKLERRGL